MNRCIFLGIIILILSNALIPSLHASHQIIPASSLTLNGNTFYVGGNGPNNFTRIQDAIDNASDGDTVFVFDESAPYYEHVVINITINLIGEDMNTTVIDGERTGTIVHMYADGINISGFTIKNSGEDTTAIRVHSNSNSINHNIIKNNDVSIIIMGHNTKNKIFGNTFINNFIAVLLGHYSTYSTICDNNFINNSYGIDDIKSFHNLLVGNMFMGNGFGIHLTASAYSIISKNNFTNNRDCTFFF
jgi:parallel beta-helix repeat protein